MPNEELPSEGELESLLREDPACFLEAVHEYYRRLLFSYIKRCSWGMLDAHELRDVYQETMLAMWQCVQKPGFDPERPLRLLYRIARNKAVTVRRRKMGRRSAPDQDAVVQAVARDLEGTRVGLGWRLLLPEERREFRQAVAEILLSLPERQRLAAQAFAQTYEELRERNKYRPLAAAMEAISGRPEDVAAAKSAWRFAREKIQEELARRGFGFMKGMTDGGSQWR
jgi:RNA polymerase sigma factor (sigma-70 family)